MKGKETWGDHAKRVTGINLKTGKALPLGINPGAMKRKKKKNLLVIGTAMKG